jgi:hypothetical protein
MAGAGTPGAPGVAGPPVGTGGLSPISEARPRPRRLRCAGKGVFIGPFLFVQRKRSDRISLGLVIQVNSAIYFQNFRAKLSEKLL